MISTYLLLSYTTNRTFVLSIGKKKQNKYRQILHFYFYKEISMTYLVRYSLRTEITSKDMITIPRRMYTILFSLLDFPTDELIIFLLMVILISN
jgi:hypothetical protein